MSDEFKKKYAAFDFDGTITYSDSLVPFLKYNFGLIKTCKGLLQEIPCLTGFLLGQYSRQDVKEKILRRFFQNTPYSTLCEKGTEFALHDLNKIVRPAALQRIQWHQKKGHECILVSANLDVYLKPWAEKMGFQHSITSICEVSNGLMTGNLQGLNCRGPEKARRLEALLGRKEDYILYAYGDSVGDREMLEMADYAYMNVFR